MDIFFLTFIVVDFPFLRRRRRRRRHVDENRVTVVTLRRDLAFVVEDLLLRDDHLGLGLEEIKFFLFQTVFIKLVLPQAA